MGHLNELHDKYEDKGLTILAVSKQPGSTIKAFIDEFECRYPTVCESSNSMRNYGRTSFPSAVLINSNGRVLWVGHPNGLQDSAIDEALENTQILPAWPGNIKPVKKAFEKGKYADALVKLTKVLENDRFVPEVEVPAEVETEGDEPALFDALAPYKGIRDWLVWYATSTLEGAASDAEAGRVYEAALGYEHVEELYKRHEYGKQATAALKELLSDKERKLEFKAGERFAKIAAEIKELKPKKALLKLKPLLAKKYKETSAGKKAAELAAAIEEEMKRN